FTIARMMRWVLLAAVLAALVTRPVVTGQLFIAAATIVAFFLVPTVLVTDVILPLTRGMRCPACGAWTLQRVAVSSFGPRYYRCSQCQARYKRDALGPGLVEAEKEDDPFYQPKERGDPWDIESAPDDDEQHGSKTIDSLVSNQRRRKEPR